MPGFFIDFSTNLKLGTLNISDEASMLSQQLSTGRHWQWLEEPGEDLGIAHIVWKSKQLCENE